MHVPKHLFRRALCLCTAMIGSSVVLAAEPELGTTREPERRSAYLPIITRESERRGVPAALAEAVVYVESRFNPRALGGVGEIGLMQIRPQTAALLGYKDSVAGLFDPEVNIRLGVMYLAGAWDLAKGDLCRTLMKYRAGHAENRMTPLSVEYCRRARARLLALGSPLVSGTEPPMASNQAAHSNRNGGPIALDPRTSEPHDRAAQRGATAADLRFGRELRAAQMQARSPRADRTAQDSARFWAAHEARIREITKRLKAGRASQSNPV